LIIIYIINNDEELKMRFVLPILLGVIAIIAMDIVEVELLSFKGLVIGTPYWILGGIIGAYKNEN
jgi:hypothetical protein